MAGRRFGNALAEKGTRHALEFATRRPRPDGSYQAGASPRGRAFASRYGEGVFINAANPQAARRVVDDILARAATRTASRSSSCPPSSPPPLMRRPAPSTTTSSPTRPTRGPRP
ncbi:LLM class flavin-dependent oxidoreductase [Streptomyces sp. NBC_00847]|nr:LLM class flavin-dependent oxidoreductase [Streptomyces sp. NBC_00847]